MIVRAIDTNNNFTFGKGLNNFRSGIDAIKQSIKTRLQSWKYDCFFDEESGVDYNNLLDIGTKQLLDSEVKRTILQTQGVIRINSFSSGIMTREYQCQADILTIYGIAKIEV